MTITIDQQNGYARIILQKEPLNVLSINDLQAFVKAFRKADRLSNKVIILDSTLQVFSAGFDIQEHSCNNLKDMLAAFNELFQVVIASNSLVVSKVQGLCIGGGFEIALLSDIILASKSSKFALPEIKLAHMAPVAINILPQIVGLRKASDIIFSGREFSADEALNMGIVSQVYEDDKFEESFKIYLSQLKSLSLAAIRCNIMALRHCKEKEFIERQKQIESVYLTKLSPHKDSQEGINAFLEKRKPVW